MQIPKNAVTLIDEVLAKANQFQKMAQQFLEKKISSPLSAPSIDQCLSSGEEVRAAIRFLGFRWCEFDPLEYHGSMAVKDRKYYLVFVANDQEGVEGQFEEVPSYLYLATKLLSTPQGATKGYVHEQNEELVGQLVSLMHRFRKLVESHHESSTRRPGIDCADDFSWFKVRGTEYQFTTPTQREVVRTLMGEFNKGNRIVAERVLLATLKKDPERQSLRDVFRPGGNENPAWKKLIIRAPGEPKHFMLNVDAPATKVTARNRPKRPRKSPKSPK